MDDLRYTWEQFFADSKKLAEILAPQKPQSLIVVARGGLFLGGMLGEFLDIPLIETISIKSYEDKEKHALEILKEARMDLPDPLIIDDIVDSGQTMQHLADLFQAKSATLFYKPKNAIIKPDFYLHETDKWVRFPWEVDPISQE